MKLIDILKEQSTKLFRVFESDDYGRPTSYMGVFKASTREEAKKKASEYYNNKEIFTTGFYGAEEVTFKELEKEKIRLLKQIEKATKIYN